MTTTERDPRREVVPEVVVDSTGGFPTAHGFLEIGRKPRYYQPDDVDAVVMKLDLRGWAARGAASADDAGVCT